MEGTGDSLEIHNTDLHNNPQSQFTHTRHSEHKIFKRYHDSNAEFHATARDRLSRHPASLCQRVCVDRTAPLPRSYHIPSFFPGPPP